MNTGTIKPNSHTQIQAEKAIAAVEQIVQSLRITKEDWNALVFEQGMQFLWQHYTRAEALKIASSEASKFWAMWMSIWAEDDAEIIATMPHGYSFKNYCEDKVLLPQIKILTNNEKI